MELAEQRVLPERIELVLRVAVALLIERGERTNELDVVQQDLRLAVVTLDRAVRGVRAAMELRASAALGF